MDFPTILGYMRPCVMSDCLLSQTITILGHSAMPLEKIITTAFVDGLHPQKLGREVYHILTQLCLNRMSPGGGVRVHTCGRRLKQRYPSKQLFKSFIPAG